MKCERLPHPDELTVMSPPVLMTADADRQNALKSKSAALRAARNKV